MQRNFIADQDFHSEQFKENDWLEGEYDNCIFEDCNFTQINLSQCLFINCVFISCDLSNCIVNQTSFQDCRFEHCKMIGIHFEDCNPFLLKFEFDHCNLSYSSFHRLKMNSTAFDSCMMHEVDLSHVDLSSSSFKGSDFLNCTFYQTNLENADLRETFNLIIDPQENKLKKAKLSLEALPGLLTRYELLVE